MTSWLAGLADVRECERRYIRVSMHAAFRVLERRGLSLGQTDLAEIREAVSEHMLREKAEEKEDP